MTNEEMEKELARLRAENALLKANQKPNGAIKVSDKGAVSVYGLQRFPVTLYWEQWLKLFEMMDKIKAFINDHRAELKTKPTKE